MITLGKIERLVERFNKPDDRKTMMADLIATYESSGLKASLGDKPYGWLTAEPTPGTLNYNPERKLCAVRFYERQPSTRRGFYIRLEIMPNGTFRST